MVSAGFALVLAAVAQALTHAPGGGSTPLRGGATSTLEVPRETDDAVVEDADTTKVLSPEIPVIDISRAMRGEPSAEDVAAIRRACELGFFHVTNHGVDEALVERFDDAMRSFFALDAETKQRYARSRTNARGYAANEFTKQRRDLKELFDYGHTPDKTKPLDAPENRVLDGYNQVPADDVLEGFAATIEAYYEACADVCAALLRCVARSLDLAPSALDDLFGADHASFLRLNAYPPLASTATRFVRPDADLDRLSSANDAFDAPLDALAGPRLGINRHFDAGGLTLLRQDPHFKHAALQMNLDAHRAGPPRWIDVGPVEGAFTVNCGDMLQVISNDRYVAAEHRVLATPAPEDTARGASSSMRYSAAFFFNPRYDARIEPRVDGSAGTAPGPKYRPFRYGHFRKRRFEGDYANEGVEEIQIAHFRTDITPDAPAAASPEA